MALGNLYYDGFEKKWIDRLEQPTDRTGITSLLSMRSTPTHMVAVVSAGPMRDTCYPGDQGPKSANPGCHILYCEQVVNDRKPLHVPDGSVDPEWRGNEDLVKFGLCVYLGYPIEANDEVLGTVCALHDTPFDFAAGTPGLRDQLELLKRDIEQDLAAVA